MKRCRQDCSCRSCSQKSGYIFVSDMDGTLTPARSSMTPAFSEFLSSFLDHHILYIVSGSDLKKVQEQMPEHILRKVSGLYCSMGNVLYVDGEEVYKNKFPRDDELIKSLNQYRQQTAYPNHLFDNYIEERIGMINFSILGRDCSMQDRVEYKLWDDVHHERRTIAKELKLKFPQYEFLVGGNISIDIVPNGKNKAQVADQLREKYPTEKIIFFGDRMEPGGNDFDLAKKLLQQGNSEAIHVKGPDDTIKFLQNYC